MMKRELVALLVSAALLAASIWNISKIDSVTDEIGIAVCKSRTATEQLNFKNSRKLVEEGMEIWQENRNYASVFLSQAQVDDTTEAFYQLMEALNEEDLLSLTPAYDTLLYQLSAIQEGEHPSIGSIF